MDEEITCANCGELLPEDHDEGGRKPCLACGSPTRVVSMSASIRRTTVPIGQAVERDLAMPMINQSAVLFPPTFTVGPASSAEQLERHLAPYFEPMMRIYPPGQDEVTWLFRLFDGPVEEISIGYGLTFREAFDSAVEDYKRHVD